MSTASGPSYDITFPPVITPSPVPNPLDPSLLSTASLPPWDMSLSDSATPTPQSSQNWATFSSDFSSNFNGPEEDKTNAQPTAQNKSIDLGVIGGSGFDNETKDNTSKLSKTVPLASVLTPPHSNPNPILAPPPSNPNPTGSLLLPPPGKTSSGPRRRGTGDSPSNPRSTSVSSLGGESHSLKPMGRPPSTSSLDRQPISPLINSQQRLSRSTTSSPVTTRSNIPGGAVTPFAVAFQEHCHAIYKGTDYSK